MCFVPNGLDLLFARLASCQWKVGRTDAAAIKPVVADAFLLVFDL